MVSELELLTAFTLPRFSVPALTVVAPVKVLSLVPESVSVPAPVLVTVPVPPSSERMPESVMVCAVPALFAAWMVAVPSFMSIEDDHDAEAPSVPPCSLMVTGRDSTAVPSPRMIPRSPT